jgi:hypothetical protein
VLLLQTGSAFAAPLQGLLQPPQCEVDVSGLTHDPSHGTSGDGHWVTQPEGAQNIPAAQSPVH